MQVTWHLLGKFFWEIYEIFRTGFTRNTRECRLLQLVVAGKCFDQKIFFKKYLIRFDIQWHVLLGIKCMIEVWRPFMMFILVCTWFVRFTSLRALFICTSGNVTSIVLITHIVIFSKQELSRRPVVCGSPGENKCSWNSGKKKQLKVNFFSMHFVRTNKEIHLSFKKVKNSGHKL